jgi:hypothetical protein
MNPGSLRIPSVGSFTPEVGNPILPAMKRTMTRPSHCGGIE